MNRLILLLMLMTSCNNNIKKEVIVEPTHPIEIIESKDIEIDGKVSYVKLNNEWESLTPSVEHNDLVALHHRTKTLLVVSYEDNIESYDDYVLQNLRILRRQEITIEDYSSTYINDVKFCFTSTKNDELKVWHFFGVKDNKGFTVSCGADKDQIDLEDLCKYAIDNLRFK